MWYTYLSNYQAKCSRKWYVQVCDKILCETSYSILGILAQTKE